jgi:hypothetical protein
MKRATVFVCLLTLTGCFRTTIHSKRPESTEYPALNDVNHGGFVNGLAESGEVRVDAPCKNGWGAIHVQTGFIAGVTNALYGLIYHTENVSLKCAAEGSPGGPPGAPPGAPSATPAAAPTGTAGSTSL